MSSSQKYRHSAILPLILFLSIIAPSSTAFAEEWEVLEEAGSDRRLSQESTPEELESSESQSEASTESTSEDIADTSVDDNFESGATSVDNSSTLSEAPARRNLAWLGWGVVGLGLVSMGLGIWSTVSLVEAQDTIDSELVYWPSDSNVCDEVASGRAAPVSPNELSDIANACEVAPTFEVIQFVFYGLGVVAIGLGLYLAIREHIRHRRSDQETSRFSFDVAFTQHSGYGLASLAF